MTLFEALPDDITEALFSYCKDDECLNDATLRALRTELKLGKAEHDKHSHDCFRCDKFKEYKNEVTAQIEKMKCCGNCKKLKGRFDSNTNINILYCSDSDMKQIEVGFQMCCCKWEIKEND